MTQAKVDAAPSPEPAIIEDVSVSAQAQTVAQGILSEAAAADADYQTAVDAAAKANVPPPPRPQLGDLASVQAVLLSCGPQRKAIDAFAAALAELVGTIQRQYVDKWNQQMAAGETPALISLAEAVKLHA